MADFSKLKRTKTQFFSKLKQNFPKTQAKFLQNSIFRKFSSWYGLNFTQNVKYLTFLTRFRFEMTVFYLLIWIIFQNSRKSMKNFWKGIKTQGFWGSKLKDFDRTQGFGNSMPLSWRPNGQKRPALRTHLVVIHTVT